MEVKWATHESSWKVAGLEAWKIMPPCLPCH